MTVTTAEDATIRLEGVCTLEDAETLARRLSETPEASVDWSDCEQAHTAVIQVLLAARPQMIGAPRDNFLREQVGRLIGPG